MEGPRSPAHHQRGFTLMELLVVMVTFTVLVMAGVPAMQATLANHRHTAHINTLTAHIQHAREESARRGNPVTLCPSLDGDACTDDESRWEKGWMVFSDVDGDGALDNADTPVTVSDALRRGTARYNRDRLTFRHDGTTAFNGTFTVCDATGDRVRELIISRSGRLRKDTGTPDDCP